MSDQDEETRLRQTAERRVGAQFGFFVHAVVYVVVNAAMALINLMTSPQTLWVIWPMMGWGIGLLMHALGVFVSLSGLRERAVEAEVNRLRERSPVGR